jgi:hypothetical protein
MENIDGAWDTIKCIYMGYSDGNLREVKIYDHDSSSGWCFDQQYLFEYDSRMLIEMRVNEAHGDSLSHDMTLRIGYDENNNPISYTEEYGCCPTRAIFITYDMVEGNDLLPFHNNFAWDEYPWIPAPAMK